MEYDKDKVDEMALALIFLHSFQEEYVKGEFITRAWKDLSWEVMNRLHEKGYISDPKGKARSVVLTDEGEKLSKELFTQFFGKPE